MLLLARATLPFRRWIAEVTVPQSGTTGPRGNARGARRRWPVRTEWTQPEVSEYENDPSYYQTEDPSANPSHRYEMP